MVEKVEHLGNEHHMKDNNAEKQEQHLLKQNLGVVQKADEMVWKVEGLDEVDQPVKEVGAVKEAAVEHLVKEVEEFEEGLGAELQVEVEK
nr:hypothetical protein Iba_chr09dCG10670 [Ipomoea batatas]